MKPDPTEQARDIILERLLPQVAFDGWTMEGAAAAATAAGYDKAMAAAVFPGGLADVVGHFSDWADRHMLAALEPVDTAPLRIRDRIHLGVMTRIEVLAPWREALRAAAAYWAVPHRHFQGARIVWRSADRIWVWAGDTATDYNHYSKRALLGGVITTTMLAWLADDSGDLSAAEDFLGRRIDNAMTFGKIIGRFKAAA